MRSLLSGIGRSLGLECHIELVEHGERFLVLRSEGRKVVADKRYKVVRVDSRLATSFEAIQSIDIEQHVTDGSSVWSVSLYLSWWKRIHIGQSYDAVDASIAAAHLSRITGKEVRSL